MSEGPRIPQASARLWRRRGRFHFFLLNVVEHLLHGIGRRRGIRAGGNMLLPQPQGLREFHIARGRPLRIALLGNNGVLVRRRRAARRAGVAAGKVAAVAGIDFAAGVEQPSVEMVVRAAGLIPRHGNASRSGNLGIVAVGAGTVRLRRANSSEQRQRKEDRDRFHGWHPGPRAFVAREPLQFRRISSVENMRWQRQWNAERMRKPQKSEAAWRNEMMCS